MTSDELQEATDRLQDGNGLSCQILTLVRLDGRRGWQQYPEWAERPRVFSEGEVGLSSVWADFKTVPCKKLQHDDNGLENEAGSPKKCWQV